MMAKKYHTRLISGVIKKRVVPPEQDRIQVPDDFMYEVTKPPVSETEYLTKDGVRVMIEMELEDLAGRDPPKNLQRDMDWAYYNMGRKNLLPLSSGCPSVSAYDLYRFAREPDTQPKFIDKYLAFTHNRDKLEGGASHEIEDDKRKQFSVLNKLASIVIQDIESSLADMVRQSPDDVVRVLRGLGWTVEINK
jgi:hypothetical protein